MKFPECCDTRVRDISEHFVYTGKRNAFIWVKSQLGNNEKAVRNLLTAQVPESRRKLKANKHSPRQMCKVNVHFTKELTGEKEKRR